MIDEDELCEVPFFDLVELGSLAPDDTLAGLSGLPAQDGPYPTSLVERCNVAWRTPLCRLICDRVLTLIGQEMGLEWLGAPAIAFARRYPAATILHPGDMTLACLRAAPELLAVAGAEMRAWLAGDFGWMDEVYSWEDALLVEARAELASARALASLQ